MDKSQEHEELIDRYLTGMADEAEVEQLDELLKTDEELRQLFLAASRLDSYVREQAEQPSPEKERNQPSAQTPFHLDQLGRRSWAHDWAV